MKRTNDKKPCAKCGKLIKNQYFFRGAIYGKGCFKKYALPILEAEWEERRATREREKFLRQTALIEALKQKDLSRIRNNFVIGFIPSVIKYFEEHKYLSKKQDEIATGLLNKKDWKVLFRMHVEFGLNTREELIRAGIMTEKDFESED